MLILRKIFPAEDLGDGSAELFNAFAALRGYPGVPYACKYEKNGNKANNFMEILVAVLYLPRRPLLRAEWRTSWLFVAFSGKESFLSCSSSSSCLTSYFVGLVGCVWCQVTGIRAFLYPMQHQI